MRTKKSFIISVLLVIVVAVFVALQIRSPEPRSNVVFVGAILPLSGSPAWTDSAHAQAAGLSLAEREIKEGVYGGGKPLVLQVRDSELDPARGASEAKRLIKQGVSALYSSFTVVTREVSPVAKKRDTILFYDSCNCGFAEENPLAFQMYFDPRKECRVTAGRYMEKGVTKAAYIGPDVPYGRYCYQELQKAFGEDNVFLEFEEQGIRKSYRSLIAKMAEEGAGVIVSVPAVFDFAGLFRANFQSGSQLPLVCFRGDCLNEAVLNKTETVWLSGVEGFDFRISPDFAERIREEHPDFGADETFQAAVAHDALIHIWKGLSSCTPGDAECVGEITRKGGYSTAIASSGFGEDRVLRYETVYVQVK